MSLRDGPFHPLRIEAVPCDMQTAREHLASFVRAFIRSDSRARAEHILFRLAPKYPDRLGGLHKLLDDRYTSPPQYMSLPTQLPGSGIYFAGGNEAWLLSLDDAKLVSNYLCRDAVWSSVAGSYAAFMYHERLHWLCYRRLVAKEP
jgi:hypothetical protein